MTVVVHLKCVKSKHQMNALLLYTAGPEEGAADMAGGLRVERRSSQRGQELDPWCLQPV